MATDVVADVVADLAGGVGSGVGSDVAAVALLALLALGGALLLRDRSPGSWPRSLVILLPLAAVVSVLVVLTGAATFLWRGVGPGEWWLPAALVAVAAVILLLARRRDVPWVAAAWLAGGVLLIGLTTLPSGGDGPHLASDPPGQLRSCLLAEHRIPSLGLGGRGEGDAAGQGDRGGARETPTLQAVFVMTPDVTAPLLPALDVRKLTTEQLPNVALFVPLGIGIAAVARRPVWWIGLAVALSVGVETYQAVFTDRTCSTVDVATNALGVLLGWAVHTLATRVTGRSTAGR